MKLIIFILLVLNSTIFSQTYQWDEISFYNRHTTNLCDDEKRNIYVICPDSGLYKSSDLGNSWGLILSGAIDLNIDTVNYSPPKFYAAKSNGDIYTSTDYGVNWSFKINLSNYSCAFIKDTIYKCKSGFGGIYKSTDSGTSWTKILSDESSLEHIQTYKYVYRDGNNNLYVSCDAQTYVGQPYEWIHFCKIGKSTDNGLTWTGVESGNDRYSMPGNMFFSNNGYAIANLGAGGKSGLILKDGSVIQTIYFVSGFTADNKNNIIISSGIDYTIYFYNNAGLLNISIPPCSNSITSLYVDTSGYLYVSSYSALFKSRFSTFTITKGTSAAETNNSIVKDFNLYPSFPNPFNPSTRIRYEIPEESHITINIFDLLGRIVKNIIETKNIGSYEMEWNASKYPSGIYFVRMTAKSIVSDKKFSKINKMVYMK
jgi:hypothetical protein